MPWKEMLFSGAVWLRGLVAAAIGGAATAVSTMVISPETFNLTTGLGNIFKAAGIAALVNVAFYLKSSPVPPVPPALTAP